MDIWMNKLEKMVRVEWFEKNFGDYLGKGVNWQRTKGNDSN